MRLCVLGATGRSGRRIVSGALERGHAVTALVRRDGGLVPHPRLVVRQVAFSELDALADAVSAHDAVINAAGYVADGPHFTALVGRVIAATAQGLGPGGRFWCFGGAALLDVPDGGVMGIDLPGVPRIYQAHRTNYEAVRATALDWSILCPGPMVAAPAAAALPGLVMSEDIWPVPRPAFTRFLPRLATSLAFKQAMPRLAISYEDAARVILDHLEPKGRFFCKRVGVALPAAREKRASP